MPKGSTRSKPSLLSRVLRTLVRALLIAFAVGFALGTWLRCEVEHAAPRKLPYLGAQPTPPESEGIARRAA